MGEREKALEKEREMLLANARRRARDRSNSQKEALDNDMALLREEKVRLEAANREINRRSNQVTADY